MTNIFIDKEPNDSSRRKFCLFLAIMPCALVISSSKASPSLITYKDEASKVFTENSKRVGIWMLEHLTRYEYNHIVNENMGFISDISYLTNTEIGQLISEDFIAGRVIDICSCIFSIKEATLCLLAANDKWVS